MPIIQIDVPEETLIGLKQDPESFPRDMRLLAAAKLVELGKLSTGRAAQLAGVTRVEFLILLGRYQVTPFALSPDELSEDAVNA